MWHQMEKRRKTSDSKHVSVVTFGWRSLLRADGQAGRRVRTCSYQTLALTLHPLGPVPQGGHRSGRIRRALLTALLPAHDTTTRSPASDQPVHEAAAGSWESQRMKLRQMSGIYQWDGAAALLVGQLRQRQMELDAAHVALSLDEQTLSGCRSASSSSSDLSSADSEQQLSFFQKISSWKDQTLHKMVDIAFSCLQHHIYISPDDVGVIHIRQHARLMQKTPLGQLATPWRLVFAAALDGEPMPRQS